MSYPSKCSRAALVLVTLAFLGCHDAIHQQKPKELKKDSTKNVAAQSSRPVSHPPVFGYRFVITGDFDGDGRKEMLIEHYYSGVKNKETNKFYDSSEYDDLVELTHQNKTYSFVLSDNKNIDTLNISSAGESFGLSYLKNEGDLNGDGTDEVSYVTNWTDWSNLNTWHIMTYKNKHWKDLYYFSMWDWQLPDLPHTINQYGFAGLQNKIMYTKDDSISRIVEKEFTDFKGLVKKIGKNKIRIIYMNDEPAIDTTVIDLKHPRPLR